MRFFLLLTILVVVTIVVSINTPSNECSLESMSDSCECQAIVAKIKAYISYLDTIDLPSLQRSKRHSFVKTAFLTGNTAAVPIKTLLKRLYAKILKLFGATTGRELIAKAAAFIALDMAADTAIDMISPDQPRNIDPAEFKVQVKTAVDNYLADLHDKVLKNKVKKSLGVPYE